MDPAPAITVLAPAPSTAVKAITRSARLEAHLGVVVAAAAAALGAALGELQDGKLTSMTKGHGGECIWQLYRLRQYLIAAFPNFDARARQCGEETLRACDVPSATAAALVDAVLEILAKIVRAELN